MCFLAMVGGSGVEWVAPSSSVPYCEGGDIGIPSYGSLWVLGVGFPPQKCPKPLGLVSLPLWKSP